MGHRRGKAIQNTGLGKIIAVADVDPIKAGEYGKEFSCDTYTDWKEVVSSPLVDVVIISVPNLYSAEIILYTLKQGKNILCEKPLGRTLHEAKSIVDVAQHASSVIRVGFNHRFHPALYRAKELLRENVIGNLMTVRARYGHGGRLGMEKEWRFQKAISGGGELLDQGVHLIDLCRWYGGEFSEIFSITETKFWDTDVEDNAFVLMKNQSVTAQFHVSVTNWKNIFSFEIFGTHGFLSIDGLGGWYGKETLTYGKRKIEFG
ncbi:MAG: Gfo/Idh/MocA family oxidoreductase, partial [Nanoarchaeota archaeon]|nr:Gfo/Idh/MocA family oxidoreductase [Nanoarchaeota archaeon]